MLPSADQLLKMLFSSEKRTLDHWANSPVLLLLVQVRRPLMTTVAKFLDTSVCGALDALTPAQSIPCEVHPNS